MKKRIFSVLLSLCMVVCFMPAAAFAEGGGDAAAQTTTAKLTGEGTAKVPYQISTADDLKAFRDIVNGDSTSENPGDSNACAILMNDITLNDGTFDENGNWSESGTPKPWNPIGWWSKNANYSLYSGTFDGKGHRIKGLYVKDGEQYAGLFGCVKGATIKDLTVDGYINTSYSAGGIAGYVEDGVTITGCTNHCTVNSNGAHAGGIVGYHMGNNQLSINNCFNTGTITTSHMAGGIVGCSNAAGRISNCFNTGAVTGSVAGGGIIGDAGTASMNITNCGNAGPVHGGWAGAGGIAGNGGSTTSISFCYNVGTVAGDDPYSITRGWYSVVSNSYWLSGTSKSDQGSPGYNDGKKSKSDFANGDVLNLLRNGDDKSLWEKCGYIAAAGMTLPLLKGQTADEHTCDYQWKYDNENHWQECYCSLIKKDSKNAHSAETGDCTKGISCECGYQMITPENQHNYPADWTANRPGTTHERQCQNAECGVKEAKDCSGGTATCIAKAKCEFCGAEYGDFNADNHADLKHVEARAATNQSEGNREYWYCESCGRYFSDEAATKEMTREDTVIAKLPEDKASDKSSQTGDDFTLTAWIALMLASGGAAAGTTVLCRRKKHSR